MNTIFRITAGFFLPLFFMGSWLGCGNTPRPDGLPKLYPVTLTLMQEDKPLPGAMVSLFPEDNPTFKWSIAAISNESGTVRLMTHGRYPGVPEGVYKVVVQKSESSNPGSENVSRSPDSEEPGNAPQSVTIYHLVEAQYTTATTTPLSITIGKGNNTHKFDLGKAVREKGETVDF